jgi:hypothetical protein
MRRGGARGRWGRKHGEAPAKQAAVEIALEILADEVGERLARGASRAWLAELLAAVRESAAPG